MIVNWPPHLRQWCSRGAPTLVGPRPCFLQGSALLTLSCKLSVCFGGGSCLYQGPSESLRDSVSGTTTLRPHTVSSAVKQVFFLICSYAQQIFIWCWSVCSAPVVQQARLTCLSEAGQIMKTHGGAGPSACLSPGPDPASCLPAPGGRCPAASTQQVSCWETSPDPDLWLRPRAGRLA